MQRHLKTVLLAGTMIITLVAGCGSDDESDTAVRPCAEVERDLDAAQEREESEDGPEKAEASSDVEQFERELESCEAEEEASEDTTTTTAAERQLSADEVEAIVDETFSRFGFEPEEVLVGDDVDFTDAPEERGDAAFSDVTIKSQEELSAFLNGDSPESTAARERLQECLADLPEDELERAMSGEGHVPIQFTVAVQYFGTTYFDGESIIDMSSGRQTGEKDILWMYMTEDGLIVPCASVRADCANPDFDRIIPVRPETPQTPPIEEVCPPGTYPENGDCVHISITSPDPCASHPELNIDVCQPPQDNDPDLVGPTPGAPEQPHNPPPGPAPVDGTPAPPPNQGGLDSGSPDGSGTPGGSTCNIPDGCEGGGSTPPVNDPVDTGQGGSNTGEVPTPP